MIIGESFRRQAVTIYFALVFLVSWGGGLVIVGPGGLPLRWEQFEKLGPLLYVAMLAGPTVAAVLMTGLLDGPAGFRDLLSRLRHWRVRWTWYALAFAPVVVIAATLVLLSLVLPDFRPAQPGADDGMAVVLPAVFLSVLFGFFEEVGWTGFAVPRLRSRHSILTTGLIVGVVWGAWHFPLFWGSDTFSGPLPFTILMVRLFSWLPPFRVLMVWIYDQTRSLAVVMAMHASLVAGQLLVFPRPLAGGRLLIQLAVLPAILWLLLAGGAAVNRWRHSPPSLKARPA